LYSGCYVCTFCSWDVLSWGVLKLYRRYTKGKSTLFWIHEKIFTAIQDTDSIIYVQYLHILRYKEQEHSSELFRSRSLAVFNVFFTSTGLVFAGLVVFGYMPLLTGQPTYSEVPSPQVTAHLRTGSPQYVARIEPRIAG
jgi:hypothetical protein